MGHFQIPCHIYHVYENSIRVRNWVESFDWWTSGEPHVAQRSDLELHELCGLDGPCGIEVFHGMCSLLYDRWQKPDSDDTNETLGQAIQRHFANGHFEFPTLFNKAKEMVNKRIDLSNLPLQDRNVVLRLCAHAIVAVADEFGDVRLPLSARA